MSVSPPALLVLAVLVGMDATARPTLPDCDVSQSRVELTAESSGEPPEVCISPEAPLTFRFDAPLGPDALELPEHERFEDVSMGARSFTLLPAADLQSGERFKVGVRFSDGAAPTSATFQLVVHPALGAREVKVLRHGRTVEDYQAETREEREKSRASTQELERMRREQGPGGLTGLLASGLMGGEDGVKGQDIKGKAIPALGKDLWVRSIHSYLSTPKQEEAGAQRVRVAVEVGLMNLGTRPWTLQGAALVAEGRAPKQVSTWQSAPLPGGGTPDVVVVETELTAREARGPFTLKLWDETGKRLVTLGNVTFP